MPLHPSPHHPRPGVCRQISVRDVCSSAWDLLVLWYPGFRLLCPDLPGRINAAQRKAWGNFLKLGGFLGWLWHLQTPKGGAKPPPTTSEWVSAKDGAKDQAIFSQEPLAWALSHRALHHSDLKKYRRPKWHETSSCSMKTHPAWCQVGTRPLKGMIS